MQLGKKCICILLICDVAWTKSKEGHAYNVVVCISIIGTAIELLLKCHHKHSNNNAFCNINLKHLF